MKPCTTQPILVAATALFTLSTTAGRAADCYPTQRIKRFVPFAAGGGSGSSAMKKVISDDKITTE